MSSRAAANTPLPWADIPHPARRLLLHGSLGRDHLHKAAQAVLDSAPAERPQLLRFLSLAQEMLLTAWTDAPLDGTLVQLLLAPAVPGWPTLALPVSDLLKAQASFWKPPAQEHPWWGVSSQQARLALVRQALGAEPKNLFWKSAAWNLAWLHADWPLADETLDEGRWPRTLSPLRHRFAAQVYLARGDAHKALASLNAAANLSAHAPDTGLRAECLLRMGRMDEASALLRQGVSRSPWRTSLWLRLCDLVSGADQALAPVPGGVGILLYTYNKARELDATLASLAESDIGLEQGETRIFALDNGCTDDTASVLTRWSDRLGERLTVLRLPVNIGAPAARNWLLSLPELRQYGSLVFLDDDVSLPGDWLLRLGAAMQAYPDASVYGCSVVDEANPLVAQSVDLSPLPPGPGDQPLVLPALHTGQPDLGQYSYLRPCVSVTGCCHLLRQADISKTGGFDIRFSPSQFDDLERDLRLGLGGGHAVYQGHLAVGHKRSSGALAERSPADIGNATANTHKLLTKHGADDFLRLRQQGEALLEADLCAKMVRLGTKGE